MGTRSDCGVYTWLASACLLVLGAFSASPASAASGCADGTREAFVNEATYPGIAGCGGTWEGQIGSAAADALCAPNWHVCAPPERAADAAQVGAITYAEATSFGGCFAFNAAHDYGLCRACDPQIGDQNDLAGVGTGCQDLYSVEDTSCLATGRVDAENGSQCGFVQGTTTGVVCCQGEVSRPVPTMSSAPMLIMTLALLIAGVTASRRRSKTT